MFIHGIDSDILEIVEYKPDELDEIIRVFINKYAGIHEKNRFHLVLNNLERSYLDWAQNRYKRSRTKLIRDSLKHTIDNDDEFAKYLNHR